jgi:alpha-1,2-mannosyltransferase
MRREEMPSPARTRPRVLTAALGLVAAIWVIGFGALTVASALESYDHLGLLDVQVYRMGGQAVLDGSSVYDAAHIHDGLPFTYTPFAAVLFVPLAAAGWAGGAVLITLASLASAARVCQLVLRQLRPQRTSVGVQLGVAALCVVVALWPVRSTLEFGQVNLIIMWLVVEDLLGVGSKRRWWAGALLGIAIGIKLTPLVFLGMLLWSRRFRRSATAIATTGATIAIGFGAMPAPAWDYWTNRLFETSRVGAMDFVANQSISGVIARTTGGPRSGLWLVGAIAVLVMTSWLGARLWSLGRRVEAIVAVAIGGLLASPISWSHHWVWLLPAVLVLVVPGAGERPAFRRARLALLGLTVAVGSVRIETLLTDGAAGWRAPGPTDWIAGNGLVIVGIAYLAFLAWVVRDGQPAEPEAGSPARTTSDTTSAAAPAPTA